MNVRDIRGTSGGRKSTSIFTLVNIRLKDKIKEEQREHRGISDGARNICSTLYPHSCKSCQNKQPPFLNDVPGRTLLLRVHLMISSM